MRRRRCHRGMSASLVALCMIGEHLIVWLEQAQLTSPPPSTRFSIASLSCYRTRNETLMSVRVVNLWFNVNRRSLTDFESEGLLLEVFVPWQAFRELYEVLVTGTSRTSQQALTV